ncbi:MAG: ester cyclase [Acidobacteriota bacterium]
MPDSSSQNAPAIVRDVFAVIDASVAVSAIHIFRVVNDKIVDWWAAEDELGLLRQLGAVITPPSSNL